MKKLSVFLALILLVSAFGWAKGSEEKVTLSFLGPQAPWVGDWEGQFEKLYPNVKIDLIPMPGTGTIEEFLQPRVVANDLWDVFFINSNAFAENLAQKGVLPDLSKTEAAKNTIPALLEPFTMSNGVVYGIPIGLATTFFYYNASMFKQVGITSTPKTWDELLADFKKLKDAGIPGTVIAPGGDPSNTWFSNIFAQKVVAKNPDYVKQIKAGTLDFTQQGVVDIFAKIKSIVDLGYAHPAYMSLDYSKSMDVFLQQKVATLFAGSWQAGQLLKADFDVGVFLPPMNDQGEKKIGVLAPETGYSINAQSKNKAWALKFLEWMNGDGFATYQNNMGNVPHLKTVKGTVKLDPKLLALLEELKTNKAAWLWFQYIPTETMPLVQKLFEQVLLGDLKPADAAAKLDQSAKASVKK